jgi:DNA-directed RNA polymerase subunit E'/Rpb7
MSSRRKIIDRIVNINPYYTKEELQQFTKKELEETLENSLIDFYGYSVYEALTQ